MWARRWGIWWRRPCGGRDVLRLAMPLVVSTGSWTVMNFVDRMFLCWYSTAAMAAALAGRHAPLRDALLPAGRRLVRQHVRGPIPRGRAGPSESDTSSWQGIWIGVLTHPRCSC